MHWFPPRSPGLPTGYGGTCRTGVGWTQFGLGSRGRTTWQDVLGNICPEQNGLKSPIKPISCFFFLMNPVAKNGLILFKKKNFFKSFRNLKFCMYCVTVDIWVLYLRRDHLRLWLTLSIIFKASVYFPIHISEQTDTVKACMLWVCCFLLYIS